MNSTRLPGKVLLGILGKPVLQLMIERIQSAKTINEIIVATSTNSKDDTIVNLCKKIGVDCFRGSEEDVLSRVASAAKYFKVGLLAAFMADNPLPEPKLIDEFIIFFKANDYDLVTNSQKTTFAPGLEFWVLNPLILYDAERLAKEPEEREHTFLYISRHPDKYKIYNFEAQAAYNFPDIHLELDTKEDFQVIKEIYEHCYLEEHIFSTQMAIDYLRGNAQLASLNKTIPRRWEKFRPEQ
jgi:spore coat polysaccharide biosynthesis protein SpsF